MKYAQIKLKDELYETLHHMAEEENRSISNMVECIIIKAIKLYNSKQGENKDGND